MSELRFVFRGSGPLPMPSKRLFNEDRKDTRRTQPPKKDSPRRTDTKPSQFDGANLAKRHLSKLQLKKQLAHYNNQIVRTLLIKIFFSMAAILLINLTITSANQTIIVFNLALALSMMDLHLGYDAFGWTVVKVVREMLKITVYCGNFCHFFAQVQEIHNFQDSSQLMWIVVGSAGINYAVLRLLWPLIALQNMQNRRSPYMSLIEKVITQVKVYLGSFKGVLELSRPIICLNLLYWLCVVIYIIRTQQQQIFYGLISFHVVRAYLASLMLLQLFLYLLSLINRKIPVQLLSPNKKQINLNLLRLDPSVPNNRQILKEQEKYIWSNCQTFWDCDFLAHRYSINYELLENYLGRELTALERQLREAKFKLEQRKQNDENSVEKGSYWKDAVCLYRVVNLLEQKTLLWCIVSHICSFQKLGTACPLHLDPLIKHFSRLATSLKQLSSLANIYEVRRCFLHTFKQIDEVVTGYVEE